MSAPSYTPMEIAAARALCRLHSTACNVNDGDLWALHGGDFLDEARTVLESAGVPEMLDALQAVTEVLDMALGIDLLPPGADGPAAKARAAIAKATGEAA